MDNNEETTSCIAVGNMLRGKLEDYKDALSSGADSDVIEKMEKDIDVIEKVYDECKVDNGDNDGDVPDDDHDVMSMTEKENLRDNI